MRLKEKVVLVTGSATGIGKAIATRVVAEGGRVVVHGLETELVANVTAAPIRREASRQIEQAPRQLAT